MNTTLNAMLWLIRTEVCGNVSDSEKMPSLSENGLKELYLLSKKHDLCHIVGAALEKKGLLTVGEEVSEAFKKQMFKAVWRYEKQNYELEKLCGLLERAEIRHLPLKGSVIRRYYSEPWLRTSCDIDILVPEEALDRAVEVLNADGGYKVGKKGSHDVSIYSAAGIHIELHYDLVEEGRIADVTRFLRDVWRYCAPTDGCRYRYCATDEFFYFYHMAHMAKHFHDGGCGIRPLLDEWILEHRVENERSARDAILADAGLLTFAERARGLSEFWFSGGSCDEITEKMQRYIVDGGVYGNQTNRVIVQKAEINDSKFKYLLSRVFERYDVLKFRYPILQRHRWLMPVMQVRRWFNLLNDNNAKRVFNEVQTLDEVKTDGITEFLTEIGL